MNLIKQLTPRKSGLIGAILAIIFFLFFLILGFLQPGYNHFRDTVSELVLGSYGWIQTINFGILIVSTILVGFSLKKHIKTKNSFTRMTFWMCIFELVVIFICPVNSKILIIIHNLSVFILIITVTLMIFSMIKGIKLNLYWKKFVPYFYFALLFNLIFGMLWFYFKENGILFEWKGLFQKIIILNMIIWLSTTGFRLWRLGINNS